jgi:hypothetical protein
VERQLLFLLQVSREMIGLSLDPEFHTDAVFASRRQRRILFISVWARKRQSAFLAPITMPLHNPFKTHGVHPHHSSSPRGGFASSSMPSLTGLAESIHKELRAVPPTAAAVASSDAIASSTLSKLPVLDRTSASPQKGRSSARPRRRRRSESVASNRSGVSIRARGKRIKA